jgi:Cu(I)/Ag(I) efflux system membrane fusion protein
VSKTIVVALLAAGAFAGLGYWLGGQRAHPGAAPHAAAEPRKPLYWYDPMYAQQKFDQPGKSPFMDMQLVPKYADDAGGAGTVSISPRMVQNLGVRTAKARSGSVEQRFETTGAVAYNERAVVEVQARAMGFIEKLHPHAEFDPVARGAPLAEIMFPEWVVAQGEFLLLARSDTEELKRLALAARQRLRMLGMSESQVIALEREGTELDPHQRAKSRTHFTLTAPISGVIAKLDARAGATVTPGQTLYRIVDLSSVWVNAEVPEAQASWVAPGAHVEARVPAYPGTVFTGRVSGLLPEVNAATRTVRARIELDNREGRLMPGMFANLAFARGAPRRSVLVPSEAVIRTGTRSVVIVALGAGRFRSADVQVGFESGGESEIRKGLKAGDSVVLSGQFLIESEGSLHAAIARLESAERVHKGVGTVSEVDAKTGRVELDHEPIASLQWPEMRMAFTVEDKRQLAGLWKGDAVRFELAGQPNQAGEPVIRRIAPAGLK